MRELHQAAAKYTSRLAATVLSRVPLAAPSTFLWKVDQHLELGGEVPPARVVEKVARDERAITVEHPHESLLGHEPAHHVFEDVREADALDGGVYQYRSIGGGSGARLGHAELVAGGSEPFEGSEDPWFGRDKALHFSATASIAVVSYAGTALVTADRRARAGVAGGLALGAGIAKELWDLSGRGDPSRRDLAWDAIGTATGVLVAWTVDWLWRRVTATTAS